MSIADPLTLVRTVYLIMVIVHVKEATSSVVIIFYLQKNRLRLTQFCLTKIVLANPLPNFSK